MQAMQSGTAAGTWGREEDFAALRYVSQHLGVDAEETPRRRRMDENTGEGRESGGDGDLIREAGELLGILHLNGALLVRPELRVEEMNTLRAELGDLIDRSWELLDQLLEFSHEMDRGFAEEGPVFLKASVSRGAARQEEEPRAVRADVEDDSGTGARRWWMLEEGAAGWIAC